MAGALFVELPVDAATIIKAIDASYVGRRSREEPRSYIGASIIGNECDAYLALCLRGFPEDEPTPRLQRIFSLGHLLEDRVVRDLQAAGVNIIDRDATTGKQFAFSAYGGHVVCHVDGLIEEETLVIAEIKSMNGRKFGEFKEVGVRISHPGYFSQVQMAMGLAKLTRSAIIAYCKDTSEYWIEVVDADPFVWSYQKERIERVLSGMAKRVSSSDTDWRCKGCFKRTSCWAPNVEAKSCKTCKFSVPDDVDGWYCTLKAGAATGVCPMWQVYQPLPKS